jgi:phosphoadenosine phosphosulfate reductase
MIRESLFDKVDLIYVSIKRLQTFEPAEGYYLAFSGGKDSIVIKKLADMAGVKYDAHYNVTTIDPPDLVKYIRQYHKDVIFELPEKSFFNKLVQKGFPQRHRRWCCEYLKEGGGAGRRVITGVRWAESQQRSKRKTVEHCTKDASKIYINPIIDWTDEDVWEFIKINKMPYCKLYDEGWKRIGCLLCPMAGKHRLVEAERYPKYIEAFKRAFVKLYNKRQAEGKTSVDRWKNGEEMFIWWMNEDRVQADDPDQQVMFE